MNARVWRSSMELDSLLSQIAAKLKAIPMGDVEREANMLVPRTAGGPYVRSQPDENGQVGRCMVEGVIEEKE